MLTPPIVKTVDSLLKRWQAMVEAKDPAEADADAALLVDARSGWGRAIDPDELVAAARSLARQTSRSCWCGGWGMLAGFAAEAAQAGFRAESYESPAGQQPVACFRCSGTVDAYWVRELRQRPECQVCRGTGLAPAWSVNLHTNSPLMSAQRETVRGWFPLWCTSCGGLGRAARPEPPHFTRLDDGWMVSFAGTTAYVRQLVGIHHIVRVLDAPENGIDALNLVRGGVSVDPALIDLNEEDARITATTSAADELDPAVKREYQRRYVLLEIELEDAKAEGDHARRAQLEEEQAALLAEIDRTRRSEPDDIRRARGAARKTIRDAVRAIRRVHPLLAEHLDRCLKFGGTISYRP